MADRIPRQRIRDDDNLLRRVIFIDPNHVREDGTATSLAFKLRKSRGEKGLSVDVERLTTLEFSIKDVRRYRLFSISAGRVRSFGLCACHDPYPPEDPDNGAHAQILSPVDKPENCEDDTGADQVEPAVITNRMADMLAKASDRLNYPDRS